MQQLISTWSSFDLRRRILLGAVVLLVFGAVLGLARIAASPGMSLLYGDLEPRSAGEVIRALEQRGITYDVRGSAVFVPSDLRDELRMTLAGEGLPANTSQGYELLDTLSGFGTTSQMFDAAYWRAKEGELARTIMANPQISAARVHLANTETGPFQRNRTPSASVSVISAGGSIDPKHARALRFLVASAVSGMEPNDVTIIDSREGIIGSSGTPAGGGALDRSRVIRERIQRLLEARVGLGNAVVEVTVETATETETIHERIFDPASRVAISTDTEERSTQSQNSGRQAVTVASNLPDGDAASDESSSNQDSETRERVNYEVSETQRELVRAPGTIKRMSVAVLVNEVQSFDESGELSSAPRDEDELNALRELVESAVGFDAARGDVVTLKSMPFQPLATAGSLPAPGFWSRMNIDLNAIAQMLVLGVVTLLLGLFVLRPLIASGRPENSGMPGQIGNGEMSESPPRMLGETPVPPEAIQDQSTKVVDAGEILEPENPLLPESLNPTEAPVERLRSLIAERQEETVEILRSWLEEREEKA